MTCGTWRRCWSLRSCHLKDSQEDHREEGERGGLGDRKPVTLTIQLEKTEYHKDIHVLRLSGKITEGPEDIQISSYHTLSIDTDTVLTIQKPKWKAYHLDRLKKARQKRPLLFICSWTGRKLSSLG